MHQSIATIDSPEFINLQPLDINPLMSKCEIKVLYLGENRNHTCINKDVAIEMSKTLRGAPIVGYYSEDAKDFRDHGGRVTLDGDGIKFECLTKPYGFVSPDADVWFQKFDDTDDFGNVVTREYLMTTGFLWTGQFAECADVLEEGRPHSMELDEESLKGHWSTNPNSGIEFFIINDAIFSKLCILGNDVEPCFEGSSVTEPTVSRTFSLDNEFKNTLYTMMQDLKDFVLERGKNMVHPTDTQFSETSPELVENLDIENSEVNTSNAESDTTVENAEIAAVGAEDGETNDDIEVTEDVGADANTADDATTDSTSTDEETDGGEDSTSGTDSDEDIDTTYTAEEFNKLSQSFQDLQLAYNNLQLSFKDAQATIKKLEAFKKEVEDIKKDELIGKFSMLSDEQKADIIAHKDSYTVEEIESKLSVIYTREKVAEQESAKNAEAVFNYTVNEPVDTTPAWIKALIESSK